MAKKIKDAVFALCVYAAIYSLLYLWKVEGIAGAGNLLAAYSALVLLAGCLVVLAHKDEAPVLPAALPFGLGRALFFGVVGVLLWFGHWVMVLCLMFTWLMCVGSESLRRKRQAAKVEQPAGA